MAKVTLRSDLQSISGRVGNILFKTYTKADGTKETRAYGIPYKGKGIYGNQRRTKVTAAEIAARVLFQKRAQLVKQLMAEHKCKTKAEAWHIAKEQIK